MAQQYAYKYAIIDETGYCYEVRDTTDSHEGEEFFIRIPEYNEEYLEKYYLNGAWYEDAAGTIPWSPS